MPEFFCWRGAGWMERGMVRPEMGRRDWWRSEVRAKSEPRATGKRMKGKNGKMPLSPSFPAPVCVIGRRNCTPCRWRNKSGGKWWRAQTGEKKTRLPAPQWGKRKKQNERKKRISQRLPFFPPVLSFSLSFNWGVDRRRWCLSLSSFLLFLLVAIPSCFLFFVLSFFFLPLSGDLLKCWSPSFKVWNSPFPWTVIEGAHWGNWLQRC